MNLIVNSFIDEKYELAESPVWDAINNRLYWVDILQGILHWFNFSDQTKHQFSIHQKIGSVALAGNNLLVAALQHGFYYIDISNKTITNIAALQNEPQTNRFNDGKCDAAGRFWAGSMSENGIRDAGKLYMLDSRDGLTEKITGVGCSNGMAWSADNKILYYIDSLSYQVVAYDFDLESGEISGERIIVRFKPDQGIPDGMTIDSQGILWIAMWNAGSILRFNPLSGKLLGQIKLPVSHVSSCTFGGATLSDLFVTTAWGGLSASQRTNQSMAGSIFCIKNSGFTGLPTQSFSPVIKGNL